MLLHWMALQVTEIALLMAAFVTLNLAVSICFVNLKIKLFSETVIRDGCEVPGANGDLFGYLDQLDGYVTASVGDPLLREYRYCVHSSSR